MNCVCKFIYIYIVFIYSASSNYINVKVDDAVQHEQLTVLCWMITVTHQLGWTKG